ncbi:MAG: VWA domain-containing protein [Pseudomonadota bacterium]
MLNLIEKFTTSARAAGLRVSTSEVLDVVRQLELIDLTDPDQFRALLRANFAKSRQDQGKFDQLFHLFFHELQTAENLSRLAGLAGRAEAVLAMLREKSADDEVARAILDFLNGDPTAFIREMQHLQTEGQGQGLVPGRGQGPSLGALGRRLKMTLQLFDVKEAVSQYLEENRSKIEWRVREDLRAHFNDLTDTALRLMSNEPRVENPGLKKTESHQDKMEGLAQRPFSSLSQREIEEMRDTIERFVRKLRDVLGRRLARRDRGVLDVKKTLRLAVKCQGVPMEPVFRKRKPRKGKVVVLCDVSGSVWSAARFMLNLLYSLQDCFTQVRSFIFVAGLTEVTRVFEQNRINEAIEKVLREADLDYQADTDYGQTFRQFKKEHLDALTKKTTLIVIGDARSNYRTPEDQILGEMRERSRRIIWLNPEYERFWNTGDSIMNVYSRRCHEVRPCRNLDQLLDFIKDLVL